MKTLPRGWRTVPHLPLVGQPTGVCVCTRTGAFTLGMDLMSALGNTGGLGGSAEIHGRAGTKHKKQGNVDQSGRSGDGQTAVRRPPREAETDTQADGAEAEKRTGGGK